MTGDAEAAVNGMARLVAPHPLLDKGGFSVPLLLVDVRGAGAVWVAPLLLAKAAAGILLPTMPAAAVRPIAGCGPFSPSDERAGNPAYVLGGGSPSVAGGGEVGGVLDTRTTGSTRSWPMGDLPAWVTLPQTSLYYSTFASASSNFRNALSIRR